MNVDSGGQQRNIFHGLISWQRLLPILLIFFLLSLAACSGSDQSKGKKGGSKGKNQIVPVTVATVLLKDMPVEMEAIGTVEPFSSVDIKSQVAGILEKVNFQEGDPVHSGDLLFGIDQRPFQARLNQALAALARDQAARDNARKQVQRYIPAMEKGYVSAEQSDLAQTSVATLEAAVQADEAAVENARLDLDNCTIRSPISGYTGILRADQGNLVKVSADEPLVTINQVTPIKVGFTLPEQDLASLKTYLELGGIKVLATLPGSSTEPLTGTFSFLDNQVDPATGTIRLKASFANMDRRLWPGQFVTVRVLLTTRYGAPVIPAQAVQTGQDGDYVYVVSREMTVAQRPVTVDFSIAGESVIGSGLEQGETVVTDGQLRLTPGAQIKVVEADSTSAK